MPDKKKVLIIEDDPHISKVYVIKLGQEGFDAIQAMDGEEGLNKMAEVKPDLVMLDLMLPKKDGFWVMQEMSKKPEIANTPVVVLSNLGQEQDKERAYQLGAKDYMVKADNPIKEVIDRVKKLLTPA
jgi:DNA-binding response OmpR family regulator